jgi:predicted dehydrogenase
MTGQPTTNPPLGIGIIGCGNVCEAYVRGLASWQSARILGCADQRHDVAIAMAGKHGFAAVSVDALLADPEVRIVLNLTVPTAHAEVSRAIISAGKHVYSEKPMATSFADALALVEAAAARGVRIGCAPDTFMGGGHQASRQLIDSGRIGRVVGGAATMVSPGMERWHPNPAFFFQRGGGPALDMGPYYITQLVNLLGPVRRVAAIATRGFAVRTIDSGPLAGTRIDVGVPTSLNGALEFVSGANVAVTFSWDVWKTSRLPLELYGENGTLRCPDPDYFGGVPSFSERDGTWIDADISGWEFTSENAVAGECRVANYRGIGVIDMAAAIATGRIHRANEAMALHVLEVLDGLHQASERGNAVAIGTSCERPAPLVRPSPLAKTDDFSDRLGLVF